MSEHTAENDASDEPFHDDGCLVEYTWQEADCNCRLSVISPVVGQS